MKTRKIYTSIFVLAVACCLTFFLLFGIKFIDNARNNLYVEKLAYLEEIALKSAQNIDEQILSKLSAVNTFSNFIAAHSNDTQEHWLDMLRHEIKANNFKRMGIITPDGTATTTDGYVFDFSDREYFKRSMDGKLCVSNSLIDKTDGKKINVYSAPIKLNGSIIGVVFATSSQEDFSNSMSVTSFDNEWYTYLVTAGGEAVTTSTNPSSIGEFDNLFDVLGNYGYAPETLDMLRHNMQNGLNGEFVYNRNGIARQVFYTKLHVTDWYMIGVVAIDEISAQSNKLITELTLVSLCIIFLIALGFYAFIRMYRKANARLEHIAYVDEVTGCKNFTKFKLDAAKLLREYPHQQYAIVSMDINKFKVINDIFGHNSGNSVLLYFARILSKNVMPDETFCRLSADNFILLLKYKSEEDIIAWINSVSKSVRSYIDSYKIDICTGVYPISDDSHEIDVICDRANISRGIAKKQNDVSYHFFKEKNRLDILSEQDVENVMESALQNKEFEVYLQPKVRISTGDIVGAEALVRWNRGSIGLVPPSDFIPLFEKNGFIRKLDLYMFESVCEIMSKWYSLDIGKLIVPVSVNISRVHLSDKNLAGELLAIANKHRIPAQLLEIELTESAVFLDGENMIEIMQNIKDAGFLISIDDFGSGYSSLSTLKDLPVDFVKIDKIFLDCAVNDTKGGKILESIISMTKWLGLSIVAEGVETQEQCNFLKGAGCDIVQGYFYSRPLPIEQFEEMVIKGDCGKK
ncbi:MAG: EAL domain-containing protein [Oscillospiraceae bacterium]